MPVLVLPRFFTKRIAVSAIGSLIISVFNAILVSVTFGFSSKIFETVSRNVVIALRSMYSGQSDMIMLFIEERRLFVSVNNVHFNRLDVSSAV